METVQAIPQFKNYPSHAGHRFSPVSTQDKKCDVLHRTEYQGPVKKKYSNSKISVPESQIGLPKNDKINKYTNMFSVKVSSLPRPTDLTQKTVVIRNSNRFRNSKEDTKKYNRFLFDDRRRLPSYARDITPETISKEDIIRQKKVDREVGNSNRPTSAIQIQDSPHTISNYRSHVNHRNQPEKRIYLQRPQSLMIYPTRLKRPGALISSHALADEGVTDLNQWNEVENILPSISKNKTSFPVNSENRMLSQVYTSNQNGLAFPYIHIVSPCCSSTSLINKSSIEDLGGQDIQKRKYDTHFNIPAISKVDVSLTLDLHRQIPILSPTPVLGKFHQKFPPHYDWNEDFNWSDHFKTESIDLSSCFKIPNYYQKSENTHLRRSKQARNLNYMYSSMSNPVLKCWETSESSVSKAGDFISPQDLRVTPEAEFKSSLIKEIIGIVDAKNFVNENFRAHEFESNTDSNETLNSKRESFTTVDQIEMDFSGNMNEITSQIINYNSLTSLIATPAETALSPEFDDNTNERFGKTQIYSSYKLEHTDKRKRLSDSVINEKFLRISPASHGCRNEIRSNIFNSTQTIFTDSANIYTSSFKTNEHGGPEVLSTDTISLGENSRHSPKTYFHSKSNLSLDSNDMDKQEVFEKLKSDKFTHEQEDCELITKKTSSKCYYGCKDILNFSKPKFSTILSSSNSLILAPEPISPARQLKLKNSVPQLMKALPPLPPEPKSTRSNILSVHKYSRFELSLLFSPQPLDFHTTLTEETDINENLSSKTSLSPSYFKETAGSETDLKHPSSFEVIGPYPKKVKSQPRLKLKIKNSNLSSSSSFSVKSQGSKLQSNNSSGIFQSASNNTVKEKVDPTPSELRLEKTQSQKIGQKNNIRKVSTNDNFTASLQHSRPEGFFSSQLRFKSIFSEISKSSQPGQVNTAGNTLAGDGATCIPKVTSKQKFGKFTKISGFLKNKPFSSKSRGIFQNNHGSLNENSQVEVHERLGKPSKFNRGLVSPIIFDKNSNDCDDRDILRRINKNPESISLPPTTSATNRHRKKHEFRSIIHLKEKLQSQIFKEKLRGWFQGARSTITTSFKVPRKSNQKRETSMTRYDILDKSF